MAEYYNVTTNLGDAEIANAIATNTKLNITHIAFGDGNGSVPTPNKARTSLVREVHRQAVTKYERHATNSNWIVIETIIPSDIGGFTIREMGIIANGKLISHGSHAPFEKLADPSGVSEYRLKFTQNITDGNVVSLILDESLIYATQAWVNENYVPRADIVNNLTTADATKPLSAAQGRELEQKKVDKTSIRKTFGNTYAPLAGAGYDFNNIMPGDYVFNDASITTLNAPPFEYASVYCEGVVGGDTQRFVIARDYFSGKLAVRSRQNGIWSGWSTLAFNSDNVASATKLQTPRNIAISGDVSGSAYFDGSGNIQINTSVNGFDNWKGQNGYTKLPNGLILQWGTQDYASNPGEVSASITFPIAFPNSCLNISLTRKISAPSYDGDGTALLISTTQTMAHISLQYMNQNTTGSLRGYTWLAIGY